LFRFFSPENTTVPSPRAHSQTQMDKNAAIIRVLFIFLTFCREPLSLVSLGFTTSGVTLSRYNG
jgi:hypothetical protein